MMVRGSMTSLLRPWPLFTIIAIPLRKTLPRRRTSRQRVRILAISAGVLAGATCCPHAVVYASDFGSSAADAGDARAHAVGCCLPGRVPGSLLVCGFNGGSNRDSNLAVLRESEPVLGWSDGVSWLGDRFHWAKWRSSKDCRSPGGFLPSTGCSSVIDVQPAISPSLDGEAAIRSSAKVVLRIHA